jgi:hypothetical protein
MLVSTVPLLGVTEQDMMPFVLFVNLVHLQQRLVQNVKPLEIFMFVG